MIVDDTDEVRLLLRTRLRLAGGFAVLGEGRTGREAVALAELHRPSLLVLDISMPDMDGVDALPLITAASPATRVVMFSGFEDQGLAARALAQGAHAFIPKSVPIEELADRLRSAAAAPRGAAGVVAGVPHGETGSAGWNTEGILGEHADRFPVIFNQAAIGMATLSLTGRIVRANPTLHELVSAPQGQLAGMHLRDLVAEDQRADIAHALVELSSGAASSRLVEHRLASAPAAQWLATTLALVRDTMRRPLYLFLQMQDISEHRAAQLALRNSEERFRLLVETVRDYGIFMLDPRGHIVSWNAGAERLKGYTASEALGQHFRLFYTDEARASGYPEHELEVASATGRYEDEGWRVRKDGTLFWANVVITALRDDTGELVGFAKVTRDVTERERLATVRAQAAQAADLLAIIAHELRSPVGIVTGAAATLERHWRELEDDERDSLLGSLMTAGSQVRRLVDDLLTAARLDAGALDIRPATRSLGPILAQAIAQAVEAADADRAAVTVDAVPEDVCVRADPDRVQQIVVNCVSNALRYGGPPVRVTVLPRESDVEIRVADQGAGVPAAMAGAVFTRFPAGRDRGGTGLGLFIVRQLALAQGGDARYERVDDTTVFAVTLPAG
ncbi:MAG: PAS domain S-box protein [Actinomycetota bacterium]|nr:PAS domain S-box protein [Actinomycetota bacterium]